VPETGIIRPVTDDEAARLAPVVAKLLRVVPETWGTFDATTMTAAEERALFLLVASEMVERRIRFRVSMPTAPTSLEAVLTATGESGFREAMEPFLAKAWSLWEERYREWNAGDARETPPFIVESLPPREWRLTLSGVLARNDIDAGDEGGLNFVLWRGFFDGRPRPTPDGRIVGRLPLDGYGKLESLTERENVPELPRVNVANWGEGADALASRLIPGLAEAVADYFKAHATPAGGRGGATEPERAKGDWLAAAMLMVRDNPTQSDAAIARAVGVHPSTLTRSHEYQLAAGMARDQGMRPARGRVDRTRGIEATAPATPDRVVGEPVPGSARGLRWERCAGCREWIRVPAAMVGASTYCERCEG